MGDKDGQVAEQLHPFAAGIVTQGLPLAEEEVLLEAQVVELSGELILGLSDGLGNAVPKGDGPQPPWQLLLLPQGAEQDVVLQPIPVVLDEGRQRLALGLLGMGVEAGPRVAQGPLLEQVRIVRRVVGDGLDPAPLQQGLQGDEPRVSGMHRARLIGRALHQRRAHG
jgi:hypothetical protein